MEVEIITIGDELLIGQIVDTNSAWMGRELTARGFTISRKSVISDRYEEITRTLNEALERVDIVIFTGGLGPTNDDITKQCLSDYFNQKLVFDSLVQHDVMTFLRAEDQDLNILNRDQTLVPEDAIIFSNKVGTAPGLAFEQGDKSVIALPGVPMEMKYLMSHEVLPYLDGRYESKNIIQRTLNISGIPEADIAISIKELEESLDENISLAYLPSPGRVRLRVTGTEDDKNEIDKFISCVEKSMGDSLWGYDGVEIEEVLGNLLKERGETISSAESCTGGYIAHLLSRFSGSSSYYLGSVVSYSNEVKERVLGVEKADLKEFGAVSQAVVEQMVTGVKEHMGTDWAVATSGIAGPTGGSKEKPVGTVWIAWAGPNGVSSHMFHFGTVREFNIKSATEMALLGIIQQIKQMDI